MVKIGIDIMGGDFAPLTTLGGVLLALPKLDNSTKLYLVGDEKVISQYFADNNTDVEKVELIHASEYIAMGEHPVKALQQKPDSSLSVGFKNLALKNIDVFASAGHSGAVMVGALHALKQVEGILRPCVASAFPLPNGRKNILLDVGINVDCKPEMLVQFAKLGSQYAQRVYGIEKPRVALLNTGSEEGKGNLLYQKAHTLLSSEKTIKFVGNIEPRDFFDGEVDVTVCDGFVGNIFLKQTEGFYKLVKQEGINNPYLNQFNYETYGGTPILGVQGNVILGHGISNDNAISNMIMAAEKVAKANLAAHIMQAFK